MKKAYIVAGSIVVGSLIFRALYKNVMLAKQWDYEMGNFQLDSTSPLTIRQNFVFINKSKLTATVRNVDVKVFSEGVHIGDIQIPKQFTVGASGKYVVPIVYKISKLTGSDAKAKALPVLQRLIGAAISKKDVDVDFVGKLQLKSPLGWVNVPVRYSSTGKGLYDLYKLYY